MFFSITKGKITPDGSVYQGGYASRKELSQGVHDDTYASVVLVKANKMVVIIALDLLFGNRSFADELKKDINDRYGLSYDEIIINYSHTHAAISVRGEDSRSDYPLKVKSKVMELIGEGLKNLIPGDLYLFKGESKFGVSRRYPSPEGILWKPYFNENCIDKDLFLLKFVDRDNNLKGLIYNYACHATTLGSDNLLISADYPGAVRKHLEKNNPGMTAVFLQGCGADIKPYITADDDKFKNCTFDELDEAGKFMADEIKGHIENSGWRKIETKMSFCHAYIKLHSERWDIEKWEAIANDPDEPLYRRNAAARTVEEMKKGNEKTFIPYYISSLKIDEKTCIIGLECEVVTDIGKKIKKVLSGMDAVVLGYSNSSMCYIPTRKVLNEGGYESASFISAGLAGQFVEEVEDIIIGKTVVLVKES